VLLLFARDSLLASSLLLTALPSCVTRRTTCALGSPLPRVVLDCVLLDISPVLLANTSRLPELGLGDFTALDVLIGGVGGPPALRLDLGTAPLLLVSTFLYVGGDSFFLLAAQGTGLLEEPEELVDAAPIELRSTPLDFWDKVLVSVLGGLS